MPRRVRTLAFGAMDARSATALRGITSGTSTYRPSSEVPLSGSHWGAEPPAAQGRLSDRP